MGGGGEAVVWTLWGGDAKIVQSCPVQISVGSPTFDRAKVFEWPKVTRWDSSVLLKVRDKRVQQDFYCILDFCNCSLSSKAVVPC